MKGEPLYKRISILTIFLLLVTLYSFINFVSTINNNPIGGGVFPYTYERCTHVADYEDASTTLIELSIRQDLCKYIDNLFFNQSQSIFFISLFMTILSWRIDLLREKKNEKEKENN